MAVSNGMFALRYVACANGGASRVILAVDADRGTRADLLFSPSVGGNILRSPGDVCVVSASSPCRILVTTLGDRDGPPDAVTLELDRLDEPKTAVKEQPRKQAAIAPAAALTAREPEIEVAKPIASGSTVIPIRIVAHVQDRGDVTATAGDMLGGANSVARIEGFAIEWPKRPAGVDISYGCSVRGIGRLPDGVVGEFVGTRQQARAINGVAFSLIGKNASAYELTVEAVFSDGTRIGPTTAPVNFAGPTGREHLVGLSVKLSKSSPSVGFPAREHGRPAATNGVRQMRVFRASRTPVQTQTA